jgi:site-specific recombinase XerD
MNTPIEQIMEDFRIGMFDAKIPVEYIRQSETILLLLLSRYDISPKETSLIVYDAGDSEIMRKFFLSKAVQGCTENTLRAYRQWLLFSFDTIGKHLKEITADDIRMLLAFMKSKGNSPAYIATIQRALSSFFTWCFQNAVLPGNPMLKVEKVKVRAKIEEALTDEQMERVRSLAITKRNRAIIEMLYSTGCRISELCALNRSDVDWDRLEIQVCGKGKKYRTVYISQRAKYAYLDYDHIRTDKSPALFGCEPELSAPGRALIEERIKNGWNPDTCRIEKSGVEDMLRKIGKKMGVRIHPHLIRKTMATAAMKRGMPIDQVRIMLGHEDISTTTIYAQTMKDDVKIAHEKYI